MFVCWGCQYVSPIPVDRKCITPWVVYVWGRSDSQATFVHDVHAVGVPSRALLRMASKIAVAMERYTVGLFLVSSSKSADPLPRESSVGTLPAPPFITNFSIVCSCRPLECIAGNHRLHVPVKFYNKFRDGISCQYHRAHLRLEQSTDYTMALSILLSDAVLVCLRGWLGQTPESTSVRIRSWSTM